MPTKSPRNQNRPDHYNKPSYKEIIPPDSLILLKKILEPITNADIKEFKILRLSKENLKAIKKRSSFKFSTFYSREPRVIIRFAYWLMGPGEKERPKLGMKFYRELFRFAKNDGLEKAPISKKLEAFGIRNKQAIRFEHIGCIMNVISVRYFGRFLYDLYKKAKNEADDEALLKVIQLDPTIEREEWVRNRISKARINNDHRFTRRYALALSGNEPLRSRSLFYVFFAWLFVWALGFRRAMSHKQVSRFLEEESIKDISEGQVRNEVHKLRKQLESEYKSES